MNAQTRPIVSTLATMLREALGLLSTEFSLLGAEMREAREAAVSAAILGAVAALFGLIGLGFVGLSAGLWLVEAGLSAAVAFTVVTVVLLLVAAVAGLSARSRLRKSTFVPKKTIDQVKKDLNLLGMNANG